MKIHNNVFLFFLIIGLFLYNSCKKDDIVVPVTGKVVDKITKNPVWNARVVYNADRTVATDSFGEFRLNFNLGRFLADSISMYVTKNNYKDRNYSGIVGNTQKDIFVIELEPK